MGVLTLAQRTTGFAAAALDGSGTTTRLPRVCCYRRTRRSTQP